VSECLLVRSSRPCCGLLCHFCALPELAPNHLRPKLSNQLAPNLRPGSALVQVRCNLCCRLHLHLRPQLAPTWAALRLALAPKTQVLGKSFWAQVGCKSLIFRKGHFGVAFIVANPKPGCSARFLPTPADYFVLVEMPTANTQLFCEPVQAD
jgi:hypothetical protein